MAAGGRRGLPKLPPLIEEKLSKTGATRGATIREIYQNRVTRCSTVLINLSDWPKCKIPDDGSRSYENGFIVLVDPKWYFETPDSDDLLRSEGLELGVNSLLLYKLRSEWERYVPASRKLPNGRAFVPATSRIAPLGGVYFARVHATVSETGVQVTAGFDSTALRGAGIRVYEYASKNTIDNARLQLEALIWMCHHSSHAMVEAGMTADAAKVRGAAVIEMAEGLGLMDLDRITTLRIINAELHTTCPLCLETLSALDFIRRTVQAEGRETYDLTTTEISLFHIQELRVGKLQHKIYNLGWGHHFCNVVVKDAGIVPTLKWMRNVLNNQPRDSLEVEEQSVEQAVDGG